MSRRQEQLDKRQAAIDEQKRLLEWKPKTDHTDAEKIAAFDRMHEFAMDYVHALKENERFKDAEHYAYEMLMKSTVTNDEDGADFWEFRNDIDYAWEG